jgi:hypothetical protein
MSFTEPIKVSCTAMWDVLNYGIQGLKNPDALEPHQFLMVIKKMFEAMMIYYVKCGPT